MNLLNHNAVKFLDPAWRWLRQSGDYIQGSRDGVTWHDVIYNPLPYFVKQMFADHPEVAGRVYERCQHNYQPVCRTWDECTHCGDRV